jgi:hypothetical protein
LMTASERSAPVGNGGCGCGTCGCS